MSKSSSWFFSGDLKTFKSSVHEFLAARVPPVAFELRDFELRISDGEAESSRAISLESLYQHYHQVPFWTRKSFLKRALSEKLDRNPPRVRFDEARSRLFPSIRDPFNFELMRLQCLLDGIEPPKIPSRRLSDRHCACLVQDDGTRMVTINDSDLNAWGIDLDEGLAIARTNLAAISHQRPHQLRPGVYFSAQQDDYDAARIFLPELMGGLNISGRLVVMTPSRNFTVITGDGDDAALLAALVVTERLAQQPFPISVLPLVPAQGGFTDLELSPSDPCYDPLKRLLTVEKTSLYGQQKEALDALFHARGEDCHVAEYVIFKDEQAGTIGAQCAWNKGVRSILPKTDRVCLFDRSLPQSRQLIATIPWSKLLRNGGDLLERTEFQPECYRTLSFPDPNRIAAIIAG